MTGTDLCVKKPHCAAAIPVIFEPPCIITTTTTILSSCLSRISQLHSLRIYKNAISQCSTGAVMRSTRSLEGLFIEASVRRGKC
jgi:hypothetical protein